MSNAPSRKDLIALALKMKTLAEHPGTPNAEASLALEKMRALIFKHGISEADLQANTQGTVIMDRDIFKRRDVAAWERALACVIAEYCGVVNLSSNRHGNPPRVIFSFVGRMADIYFAEFLFTSLRRDYLRAASMSHSSRTSQPCSSFYLPRPAYIKDYCLGCVHGLRHTVNTLKADSMDGTTCTALALSRTTEAQAFIDATLGELKTHHIKHSITDREAFSHGIHTGRASNLSRPLTHKPQKKQPALTDAH